MEIEQALNSIGQGIISIEKAQVVFLHEMPWYTSMDVQKSVLSRPLGQATCRSPAPATSTSVTEHEVNVLSRGSSRHFLFLTSSKRATSLLAEYSPEILDHYKSIHEAITPLSPLS